MSVADLTEAAATKAAVAKALDQIAAILEGLENIHGEDAVKEVVEALEVVV